ncbi:MAG: DUF262 domain-containing HNH endonuclease family protein [Caldisericia bacterium]|nr:DUF262 domain-containing HNH endonuclease family protein [Caldisericia bacterium]
MEKISAKEKSIRDLLFNKKYFIDYYQREYKWQTKQLQELIEDLMERFIESYDQSHERTQIQNYGKYFLGSIIICEKNGSRYIVDGQQRLTTITLLLIYLRNILKDEDQKNKLYNLIFSDVFGKKSFNIDVDERNDCMMHLVKDVIPSNNIYESIANIVNRYTEIPNFIPDELDEKTLLFFSDWLIENVYLVEITTQAEEDAYFIFETMNDRGLSLTPLEMLKGYLLSNINDTDKREKAADIWKEQIESLRRIGKDEDAEAFKAWLRGQYAKTTRERKKKAKPQDFDKIGTELHRWVRDNENMLGLKHSGDFYDFINRDMKFYTEEFRKLKEASKNMQEGLETIFYNAYLSFTLQYPVLLAPINIDDDPNIIIKKYQIIGTYLDILIVRRIWNFRSIVYSTMQYFTFNVIKDIRGKNIHDLSEILLDKLKKDEDTFLKNKNFSLHKMNKFYIRYILARMTEYIEIESGMASKFLEYIAPGSNRYEIEHIWSNNAFNELKDDFAHISEFEEYRNRIGGLILLPKNFNASYSDLPYSKKLPHYFGQNLLAKSLHENCYIKNPGFLNFVNRTNLPFKNHFEFKKKDLEERQELYCKLAELIWSLKRLEKVLEGDKYK